MAAPEDAPTRDLMVWTPTVAPASIGVFQTPIRISDDLAAFLDRPSGTSMTRPEVTRGILKYIMDNGLIDGQRINPDIGLRVLLQVHVTEQLSILTLNKFLRRHFMAPPSNDFTEWWSAHEESLWVGVDMTRADIKTFANVYDTIMKPEYAAVRFTIYTGLAWVDDSNAPCGCTGYDGVCEYHRGNPDNFAVAPCGCSEKYNITCEYHVR